MPTPLIFITLAYIAGLLLGSEFLYFPYTISFTVILGILITGIFVWIDKLTLRRSLIISIPCIAGIAAYVFSAAWLPSNHYTRLFPCSNALHDIAGRISSPLDRDPDRTGFVIDVGTIDGVPVSGRVRVSVREAISSVGYGDAVRMRGKFFEPRGYDNPGSFDYAAYLAQNGIYYTVGLKNADAIEVLSRGSGIFKTIQDWRERIRQAFLAKTTGPGSAIVQAMTLGEEGGLTEELRDRFMAAGVTHIISISGSHLGMVALLCFGLIRWLLFLLPESAYHRLTLITDPKKIAAWLTLPLVVFYTLLAGGQVATVRSLIMISAGLAALILDRDHALMHSLALAALIILVHDPQAVFDISFQLSYISVLVIGSVVSVWNELGIKAQTWMQKIRNSVMLMVTISLATGLSTGPLVAHYFNQISFAGILSNMIVVPFAGMLVVPLGLLSGVLSLFMHHLPFAALNQIVADAFIRVVTFFAGLPFSEFHPPAPNIVWLFFAVLFLMSLFGSLRTRLLFRFKPMESTSRISRSAVAGIAISAGFLVLSPAVAFLPGRGTVLSFPDVGQGDCALIELASGKRILIDGGGTRDNRFDIGRRVLAPYLWNRGAYRLDLVVLSHPHPDHMNGLLYIARKFAVREVWTHGYDADLPGFADFRTILADRCIPVRVVSADDLPMMLGDTELRVLHPDARFRPSSKKNYDAENNRSLVIRVAGRDGVFLFPGDIGKPAERYLARYGANLSCDVLKAPHHGSKTSSTSDFLSLARPKIAIVTVGRGNRFHHPADEVLARYKKTGAKICRTDNDGAVSIRAREGRMDISKWGRLMLTRVVLNGWAEWGERERRNWERLLLRAWGT